MLCLYLRRKCKITCLCKISASFQQGAVPLQIPPGIHSCYQLISITLDIILTLPSSFTNPVTSLVPMLPWWWPYVKSQQDCVDLGAISKIMEPNSSVVVLFYPEDIVIYLTMNWLYTEGTYQCIPLPRRTQLIIHKGLVGKKQPWFFNLVFSLCT